MINVGPEREAAEAILRELVERKVIYRVTVHSRRPKLVTNNGLTYKSSVGYSPLTRTGSVRRIITWQREDRSGAYVIFDQCRFEGGSIVYNGRSFSADGQTLVKVEPIG